MIFDNADGDDREDLLREFWPKAGRGSILITSRDQKLVNQFGGVELTVLEEDSAVDLLMNLTKLNRARLPQESVTEELDAAKKIVQRIDFLPLGINQAANLIVNDSCSLTEFFEAYNNRELIQDSEEVRLVRSGSTYQYSLRTVWSMNFETLTEEQQDFIKIISFLDPDRIQMRLFSEGVSKSQDPNLSFIDTAYKRNKCKVGLLRSSLVSQSEKFHELRMHRLVQASCHLRMDLAQRQRNFKCAITLVKNCFPVPPRIAVHNPALWEDQQAFLPHVQTICSHYVTSCQQGQPLIPHEVVDWEFASILYEAGWYVLSF